MGKNGINKLLDLLNEYAKVLGIGNHIGWHNRKTVENSDFIFYKKFGFIDRLLENDKIDREKYYEQEYKPFFWNSHTGNFQGFLIERGLLMLLAVSENPIDDLISYLK